MMRAFKCIPQMSKMMTLTYNWVIGHIVKNIEINIEFIYFSLRKRSHLYKTN
jgi:hypothetical protein